MYDIQILLQHREIHLLMLLIGINQSISGYFGRNAYFRFYNRETGNQHRFLRMIFVIYTNGIIAR